MSSLISYVENLRERPEHVRRRAAFWWSFGFTAIVLLFWLASFSFTGNAIQKSASNVAQSVSGPGESLVAGVGTLANDVWSSIAGPKKFSYSEVQVSPGKN